MLKVLTRRPGRVVVEVSVTNEAMAWNLSMAVEGGAERYLPTCTYLKFLLSLFALQIQVVGIESRTA